MLQSLLQIQTSLNEQCLEYCYIRIIPVLFGQNPASSLGGVFPLKQLLTTHGTRQTPNNHNSAA